MMNAVRYIVLTGFLLALSGVAFAAPEPVQSSAAQMKKFAEVLDAHISCQDKVLSLPASSDSTYTSVRTRRVCAPTHIGYFHNQGIEADCAVHFKINAEGKAQPEKTECNIGINSGFDANKVPEDMQNRARHAYRALSGRTVRGWEFDIGNALEAENLGKMVLPFRFVLETGDQTFEPILDTHGPGVSVEADELVDQPEATEKEAGE